MFNNINWVEWLGYAASILVAISLLMSSLIKLRWYNLVGSVLFALYGYSIKAVPIAGINSFIVCINIYYLIKIYTQKESFKIVEFSKNDNFIVTFFDFYKDEIKKFFPDFKFTLDENTISFCVLRNMVPAGVFVATKKENDTLFIELDFVTPAYRDFKIGKYLFNDNNAYFTKLGYKQFAAKTTNQVHNDYLKKMGFAEKQIENETLLVKSI